MIEIIHGDSLDLLLKMEPSSFDAVVTDPPFGETSLPWDNWPEQWPSLIRRVLKKTGSMWVFGSFRSFTTHWSEFSDFRYVQEVIWEKHNGSNAFADRFRRVHEIAVQFRRSDSEWADIYKQPQFTEDATARTVRRKARPKQWGNIEASSYASHDGGPRLMRSVIAERSDHGTAVHPTQKPIALLKPLLAYACPPGGRVLDPFAGSGGTGLAAKQLGIDAVLIEADAGYVEAARKRLREDAPLLDRL